VSNFSLDTADDFIDGLEAHPPKLLLKASASRQAPYSGECVTGSIRDRTTSVVAGSRTGTNVMVGQAWQASKALANFL